MRLRAPIGGRPRPLLLNSLFLIANTVAGSCFGFLFWLVAARRYTPSEVGLGAAYISSLTFLATLAELGLGTALIRFAPAMGGRRAAFINSALASVAASSLGAAALFALGTPIWSPELGELGHPGLACGVFVGATAAFSLSQLLDRVFVAFEAAHFLFLRNLGLNVVRVALIVTVGRPFGATGLVVALGGGAGATLLLAAALGIPRAVPGYRLRSGFAWGLLRDKLGYTLGNHVAALLWGAPMVVYSLLVVNMLGTSANGHFYLSWMVANMLFVVPTSVATSAFARAANSGYLDEAAFWRTMRLTLAGLLAPVLILAGAAPLVLRVFGDDYGAQGRGVFLLLLLSAFPYAINTAVIVRHRLEHHAGRVIWVSGLIALLCLGQSAALGARYGLPGIGAGWLGGQVLGALAALLSCRRATRPARVVLQGGLEAQ